jgi:hypothetical protein
MVSLSWMSATQFLKATYHQSNSTNSSSENENMITFSAPFLACWFCMMGTIPFFPFYLFSITICSCWDKKNKTTPVLQDAINRFRETGITLGTFAATTHDIIYVSDYQDFFCPVASYSVSSQ